MTATKIDLRRELHALYAAPRDPVLVDVPELQFLMVDGRGDPESAPAYRQAIEALYGMAYTIKFDVKKSAGVDYGVPPLEGLWWAQDMTAFAGADRDAWEWTMMIMQPGVVGAAVVEDARAELANRKPLPALELVRLAPFAEGRAAQVLHVGSYAIEAATIERLHAFIGRQGLRLAGRHHEIYLGDPRRSAPERLRTIIRQPVAEA